MRLTVNGLEHELSSGPLEPLLHALREELGITSPKAGCQEGGCGACTVLVDGEPRRSCLVPLAAVDGSSITTVEGLGHPGRLSIVQAAFHEQYGIQCGFCTPGFVLATVALLERNPSPSRDEILAGLGGHVCRCTGYVKIVAAVEAAARGDVSEDAVNAGATGSSRGEPEVVVTGSPA
jgi:aerobic-type carbon monoxide dehydrogenase small subunit (CoxS/CutS family)